MDDLDRRRRFLTEMFDLVVELQFNAAPHANRVEYFRSPEQLKLQSILAGIELTQVQREWQAVSELAGTGHAHMVVGAAVRARNEIEAAMRKLPPVG